MCTYVSMFIFHEEVVFYQTEHQINTQKHFIINARSAYCADTPLLGVSDCEILRHRDSRHMWLFVVMYGVDICPCVVDT